MSDRPLSNNARRTLRSIVDVGGVMRLDGFNQSEVAALERRGYVKCDRSMRTVQPTPEGIAQARGSR